MDAVKIKLSELVDLKGGISEGNYGHRVHLADRAPTSADVNFYLGTIWIENEENVWVLVKTADGAAVWYKIVTPEFTSVVEVINNINSVFNETKAKADSALQTANSVRSDADAGNFDGFDPIITLTEEADGVKISVEDANGVKEAKVPQGPKGNTGTIQIGSVITGAAGSEAKVENTGTETEAVLDITIPRGQQGFGLTIKGKYDSLDALKAAHPTGSEGDNWQVTSGEENLIYTWNAEAGAWQSLGELRGATGAHFTPEVTGGVLSWTNEEGLQNPADYDLLADTKEFITGQGYADGAEVKRLINNTLYQTIQEVY